MGVRFISTKPLPLRESDRGTERARARLDLNPASAHPPMFLAVLAGVGLVAPTTPSAALLGLIDSEKITPDSFLCRSTDAPARIDDACRSLEAGAVAPCFPRDLMSLDGTWNLAYSSTLANPLPIPLVDILPTGVQPSSLVRAALEASEASAPRAVSQRIDVIKRRVVNEVALAPWPRGNSIADTLAAAPGPLGSLLTALQQATVRLELDHAFSVEGDGSAGGGRRQAAAGSVVDLRLESVVRTLSGLPPPGEPDGGGLLAGLVPRDTAYTIPPPLTFLAAGAFETTYVDSRVRISRGVPPPLPGPLAPPPELRVFVREGGDGPEVFTSWQEEEDARTAAAASGEAPEPAEWSDRWQEGGFEEAEGMDFADDGVPD